VGEVVAHTLEPRLCERLALVGDDGGDQRRVVDVLAGPNAHFALPLGVGQVLVGDAVELHAVFRGVDHAPAHGEAEPVPVGVAVLGGDLLLEHRRLHGLGQPGILGLRETAGIDGEQHVGRAVATFGGQTLVEAVGGVDHVGLDAGLDRERLEQRVDQLRLAVGVDVDLLGRSCGRPDGQGGNCECNADRSARAAARLRCGLHTFLQSESKILR
jgi:hypothetical protein